MNKFKVGFVGVGFFCQSVYLKNLAKRDDVEIVAFAEAKKKLRDKIKKKYQIPNSYKSHLDLIKFEKDLDIIFVITGREYMPLIVNDCLKKSYNVFSEKPMASNIFQAKKIIDSEKKGKSIYFSGYMRRFDKGVLSAKKIFEKKLIDKSFGKLISITMNCYDANPYLNENDYIKAEKKTEIKLNGWQTYPDWINPSLRKEYASFINRFSHNINLIRFFFNEKSPEVLFSKVSDLHGNVIMKINDVIINFENKILNFKKRMETLKFFFEKGIIKISLPHALAKNIPSKIKIYQYSKKQDKSFQIYEDWSWSFDNQINYVLNALKKKKNKIINSKNTFKDILLIETIWKKNVKK